jgi:dTDP-4-amino-4,6-dideoxygalactose transaminase
MEIAHRHDLLVIEDAAQALLADYHGRPLGGIGHMAALSFHETKNIISGEGGALLVNDPRFVDRAEIVWEKGTNRSQFFRGQVDKYTWVDLGSSYLPGEIIAAFLWAQMEEADAITARRLAIWADYHGAFVDLELTGAVRRPIVPPGSTHNAHMYQLLLPSLPSHSIHRVAQGRGIQSASHTPALIAGDQPGGGVTCEHGRRSERLARLPLWLGLVDDLVTGGAGSSGGASRLCGPMLGLGGSQCARRRPTDPAARRVPRRRGRPAISASHRRVGRSGSRTG